MIAAVRRGRRDASRETPRANRTESGLQAHPLFIALFCVSWEYRVCRCDAGVTAAQRRLFWIFSYLGQACSDGRAASVRRCDKFQEITVNSLFWV